MTEQEAFEIAYFKAYPLARFKGLPKIITEVKDFEKGWDACKEYVKQGQEPVGWQFKDENGIWCYGDDRIKDHKENTIKAGYEVRDVYAHPTPPHNPMM